MSPLDHAREAADAQCALYIMGAVVAMLEGGTVVGGSAGCNAAAQKIILLARKEQQRQLRRFDKHMGSVGRRAACDTTKGGANG